MDKGMLCAALSNVCESELLGTIDEEAYEEHRFSSAFEKKMQGIIRPKEPVNIRKRIRLALVLAAMLAAGFLLGMTTGRVWGFKLEDKEQGVYASFDVGTVKGAKSKITEVYELGFAPDGYELTENNIHPFGVSVSYLFEKQSDNDNWQMILFSQCTPNYYKNVYFGEGLKQSVIFEDGVQYYISEPEEDYTVVIWYEDGYVMVLSGTVNKNTALDLCKSVKMKEN